MNAQRSYSSPVTVQYTEGKQCDVALPAANECTRGRARLLPEAQSWDISFLDDLDRLM